MNIGNFFTKITFCVSIFFSEIMFLPANIYLLKVNNRNTRKRCEICSRLKLKTPERRQ